MSSRVLSGSKIQRVEPVHWLLAFGQPINASPPSENQQAGEGQTADSISKEMEGALQRIQVLERRIHELESELPRRQEIGRQEGHAEGERTGADAANARLQPLFDRLSSTIGELASYRARFRRDSEPELLKLALAVARKILRRELTVDPHSLLGILKAAMETINQSEVLCVRTAPASPRPNCRSPSNSPTSGTSRATCTGGSPTARGHLTSSRRSTPRRPSPEPPPGPPSN